MLLTHRMPSNSFKFISFSERHIDDFSVVRKTNEIIITNAKVDKFILEYVSIKTTAMHSTRSGLTT